MASFVAVLVLFYADLIAQFAMFTMVNYLTNVWNISTTHAAGILNIWNGTTPILGIMFALLVDAFMGDYYMLVVSSTAYTMGLGLLWMSTPPVSGPCSDYIEECIGQTQEAFFFSALVLIAVGIAGHLVSLTRFIELQYDDEEGRKKTKVKTKSIFPMLGQTIIFVVQISPSVARLHINFSYALGFGISAMFTLVATLVFLMGSSHYKDIKPEGMPLIYNDNNACSTSSLRFLDNADIVLPKQESRKRTLCSVQQLEDIKIFLRMLPMCLTFIMIGMVLSVGNTYFIEQANHLDYKLGIINVNTTIFLWLNTSLSLIFAAFSDSELPTSKYAPPVGIATSMVLSVLCCIIAAIVETHRLDVIRDYGLVDKADEGIPMSVFWLVPQFLLLGAVEGISKLSINDFFKNQVPKQMHKYLIYFTEVMFGIGTMASVFLVYVVGKVSERNGKLNWFQFTLSKSRLDLYYWILALLSTINLAIYVVVAYFYNYEGNELVSNDGDEREDEG